MPSVTFQATAQDLIDAHRALFRWSLRRRRFWVRAGIGAFIMAACCRALLPAFDAADQMRYLLYGAGGWAVFLGTVLTLHWLLMPRRLRRIYAQQRSLHHEATFAWTDQEASMVSSRSASRYSWLDLYARLQDRHVIVLMQSEAAFNFIPKRVLTPEQGAEIMGAR